MSRTSLGFVSIIFILLSGCAQLSATGTTSQDTPERIQSSTTSYVELLASGDDAFAQNDLDRAQVKYALAVNLEPKNLGALYKLAIVHYRKKSYDVSAEILKRVIALQDSHAGALETLGFIALQKEKFAQAESHFVNSLKHQAERWRALNGLGIVKDMQAQHDRAQAFFRQAKLLVADNAAGMARVENNLGYSLYLQGNYNQSLRHFINATRYAPDYAKAWSNLALGLAREGRYEDARAAFGKLVDKHVAANNLGFVGLLIGDFAMARREINSALQLAPSYYALANENHALLMQRAQQGAVEAPGIALKQASPALPADTTDSPKKPVTGASLQSIMVVPAVARSSSKEPSKTNELSITSGPLTAEDKPVPAERNSTAVLPVPQPRKPEPEPPMADTLASYLRFLGYEVSTGSEHSDAQLNNAVRNFQISHGLAADGTAGKATAGSITRATVQRVQLFLASLGLAPGEQNGILHSATRDAIKAYKAGVSLPVDAKLDASFLERLSGHTE